MRIRNPFLRDVLELLGPEKKGRTTLGSQIGRSARDPAPVKYEAPKGYVVEGVAVPGGLLPVYRKATAPEQAELDRMHEERKAAQRIARRAAKKGLPPPPLPPEPEPRSLAELPLAPWSPPLPTKRERDALDRARREVEENAPPKTVGLDTSVLVIGERGKLKSLPARYELREAEDILTSHDPLRNFQPTEGYPKDVQERAYHVDQNEQGKVIMNAQEFLPGLVVNTNPDAVNGPPLLTHDGYAVGGNSRAMSMRLLYRQGGPKADELRAYLASQAHESGFTPADVAALRDPVLVRVLEKPEKRRSKEDLQLLVRQMNESLTQSMDPRTAQVAAARRLSPASVASLGTSIEDEDTLNTYLKSPRGKAFIDSLFDDGVFTPRNASSFFKQGKKNLIYDDGVRHVEGILVGKLLDNADILRDMRDSNFKSLARSAPYVLAASEYGPGYDLRSDLKLSVSVLNDFKNRLESGKAHFKNLDPKMDDAQFEKLFSQKALFDDVEVDLPPRAKTLLKVLIKRPGVLQLSNVMRDYLAKASRGDEKQSGLFGVTDPEQVFQEVADKALRDEGEKGT